MNPKDEFIVKALRAVVNEYLGTIAFEDTPDLSSMSSSAAASYKRGASPILRSKTYQGERLRIVENAKQKFFSCTSDVERATQYGVILGVKFMDDALKILASTKQIEEED